MYCTSADLLTRISSLDLARLTNDTVGATSPDPTVVDALITRASSIIDSYASQVYVTPLVAPVDDIIRQACIDLTIIGAMERRPVTFSLNPDWKQTKIDLYGNTDKSNKGFLQSLADQEIQLNSQQVVSSPEISYSAPDKLMDFNDSSSSVSLF